MIIHVLANDGSPLNIDCSDIYGESGRIGLGGAELALLTLCQAWHERGDEVVLYNDPKRQGSPFEQRMIADFDPRGKRDVLVIFRSPSERSLNADGLKCWFSTDQRTIGDFQQFSKTVHKIVTISPFHADYFARTYAISNTVSIDLPVRTWDYKELTEKVPGQCIFCSIPDRGVMQLQAAWPLIAREVPEANLVITSDWRLWVDWADESMIQKYKLAFAHHPRVSYFGAIKRRELVKLQQQSQLMLFPCIYEELFCISAGECQVAGAYPITSDMGALPTTNMGTVIPGSPTSPAWIEVFVKEAIRLLQNPDELAKKQRSVQKKAIARFSVKRILKLWDEVFDG
jgi:glycosyltransferase involved in cell wall biosynthesis